jgi:hypothetical protein
VRPSYGWMYRKEVSQPVHIIDRARAFVQSLRELAARSAWEWRRCPYCGRTDTQKWGTYSRHPWYFEGRKVVVVQRHHCRSCQRTYSEQPAWLVPGSWYAREVHRYAIDHWQHTRSSLRRTAEQTRSWLGKQERYLVWRPWVVAPREEALCHLSASTVHRWLDHAGEVAQQAVEGQWDEVVSTEVAGTDGLWARLRGGAKRVVLALVDSVTGVIWPPVVVEGEDTERAWQELFRQAAQAGLALNRVRAITSDGNRVLGAHLKRALSWVHQQRCVWHVWRTLGRELSAAIAGSGLAGEAATAARREVVGLLHAVMDAVSYEQAEEALEKLRSHSLGTSLACSLNQHLDRLLIHRMRYCRGISRVGPEWMWRDFRLRLSRGRNHGSPRRLQRAALVWAIYHNFTPAQWRSEKKRHYRHPGRSPLEVAGASPGRISYLDALEV